MTIFVHKTHPLLLKTHVFQNQIQVPYLTSLRESWAWFVIQLILFLKKRFTRIGAFLFRMKKNPKFDLTLGPAFFNVRPKGAENLFFILYKMGLFLVNIGWNAYIWALYSLLILELYLIWALRKTTLEFDFLYRTVVSLKLQFKK